jgi:hypothetical protein
MTDQLCDAYVVAAGRITCTCMKPPHAKEEPHECACNGAWFGDGAAEGKPDFIVVRYPQKIVW